MGLQSYWYRKHLHPLLLPLLPFSAAFGLLTGLRRWAYQFGLRKTRRFSLPVVVVGNISVGGTGKTPLVIALARNLREQGWKPGIALRGVGGQGQAHPCFVTADSDPFQVGDEAVLIAKNTACPVAACVDRPAAVEALQQAGCDLVLCDDGLQHYRLARTVEIAVIDGSRYFGNGRLLPAGPLREPFARLKKVDFIVVNAANSDLPQLKEAERPCFPMQLNTAALHAVHQPEVTRSLADFRGQAVHALVGIGNPQRFFDLLVQNGIDLLPHPFRDHHLYQSSDLHFSDTLPILMTEKDAVKCQRLPFSEAAKARQWFLRVEAQLSEEFKRALVEKIKEDRL